MDYYAVKEGRNPGIYRTWDQCKSQVLGYSGAVYKKFKKLEEAQAYMANGFREEESDYGLVAGDYFEDEDIEKLGEDEAVAYVDGSFDLGSFTYSYGVVYFTKARKKTLSGRLEDEDMAKMRNVSGELAGAKAAMDLALKEGKAKLYLHYDYAGIEQWALGNWKANKDGVKAYVDFYEGLKKDLEVDFIKVPAHTGVKYNEEADRLAKEAILK